MLPAPYVRYAYVTYCCSMQIPDVLAALVLCARFRWQMDGDKDENDMLFEGGTEEEKAQRADILLQQLKLAEKRGFSLGLDEGLREVEGLRGQFNLLSESHEELLATHQRTIESLVAERKAVAQVGLFL